VISKMKIDIGCGNITQRKKGYTGIDVNPDYQPDILHDCNEGLPFSDNEIEAISSDNSLEHFWNHVFVLQECYRVLKPGGILELVLPNTQYFPILVVGFFTDIMKFWNWYMNLSFKKERTIHITLWTKHTAEIVLRSLGFEILETKGFHLAKEFYIKAAKPASS